MLLKAALDAGPALASPARHHAAAASSFGIAFLQRQVSALATHTGPGPRRLFCGTGRPPRSFSGPRTRAALPATAKAVAHRQSLLNTQSPVYFSTLCYNVQSSARSSTGECPPVRVLPSRRAALPSPGRCGDGSGALPIIIDIIIYNCVNCLTVARGSGASPPSSLCRPRAPLCALI